MIVYAKCKRQEAIEATKEQPAKVKNEFDFTDENGKNLWNGFIHLTVEAPSSFLVGRVYEVVVREWPNNKDAADSHNFHCAETANSK